VTSRLGTGKTIHFFTVRRPKFVFFTVVLTSEEAEPCVEDGEASEPVGDLQSRGTFNAI
jgi:hypothetical protein